MANSFVHIELNIDDPAGAKKFYKQVFDWKFTDTLDGSYIMIDTGGGEEVPAEVSRRSRCPMRRPRGCPTSASTA